MCGSRLPEFQPMSDGRRTGSNRGDPTTPVSGPSFLGLADEPTESATYLLEDDQSSAHWGRRVFVMLLLACVAVAGWHWRQPLREWAVRAVRPASIEPASVEPASVTPASGIQPAGTQAGSAPAANTQGETSYTTAPISTSGSEVAGSMANATSVNEIAAPAGASQPQSQQSKTPVPAEGNAQQANPVQSTNPGQPTTAPQPQPSADATSANVSGANVSAANVPAANVPAVNVSARKDETSPSTGAPEQVTAKKSPNVEIPGQPAVVPGQGLETEGEKYLYGSGVPANCAHAQKSLLAAAQQSNSKAESVLGTMYATGHCVTRDLPLAYSWFAKAMQQEPTNARVERDLLMVWNQMTPDERQLAIHHK
jgi:hypothetical protein